MKQVLLVFISLCACCILNAQEKPDMFEFLSTFERQTTIEEFKVKYADSLHPLNDSLQMPNDAGLFFTELFNYEGSPSAQIVVIEPSNGAVTICAIPDLTKVDSLAYSQASVDLRNYVIRNIGEPDLVDDNISDNAEFLALFTDGIMENGKRYLWENEKEEAEYAAFSVTSKGTEMFVFMILPQVVAEEANQPLGLSSTPLQRIFFKKLELGKYIASYQLANYLDVSSYKIVENKTSEGKIYQVLFDGYFGGHKWDLLEINSVDDKLSSIHFTNSKTSNNKHVYEDLLEKLTSKYGEPMVTDETSRGWYDSSTMISLYYVYGPNNGGEWRHFVVLGYVDRDLYDQGTTKATDEL